MKVGDVVKLMSGGCAMTISCDAGIQQAVTCVWHDDEGRPHRETYLIAVLRIVRAA